MPGKKEVPLSYGIIQLQSGKFGIGRREGVISNDGENTFGIVIIPGRTHYKSEPGAKRALTVAIKKGKI